VKEVAGRGYIAHSTAWLAMFNDMFENWFGQIVTIFHAPLDPIWHVMLRRLVKQP
jgi:hypothetical protein